MESDITGSFSQVNSKNRFSFNLRTMSWVLLGIGLCISVALGEEENYDFIIAGGGTGGLAVARRLSEGGKHSVLVLESGDFPKEGMDIPAHVPRFMGDRNVTFRYTSTPQPYAALRNNGTVTLLAGRVLGGTSNINFMWINRGNPRDYDNWANITQDKSWNYSNMLKYFRRVETYTGMFPSDQHGYKGPLMISRPKYAPGLKEWLAAGKYLGYPIADPNGPQKISFAPVEFSKRFGRRDSSFSGYIQPILESTPNLHIITNTNVTQIIFEGSRAVGVRFASTSPLLSHLSDNCLYANKEIIVSAGAYGSPQILLRSGIGPKKMLRAAKIPVVKDLPVGENFHNHVLIPVPVLLNDRNYVMDEVRDLTPQNLKHFEKFGDGPYSNTRGSSGQGFVISTVAEKEGQSDWPDIQFFVEQSVQAYFSTGLISGGNSTVAPWEGPMSVSVFLARPKSKGRIRLNPTDPNGLPLMDVGYLSDPRDVQLGVDGIKMLIRIFEETPVYKKLGARLPPINIPSCRKFTYRSDDYWKCYVHHVSTGGCHPAGTCRMGRGSEDPRAVVDSKLRVIGITGLRVTDASIMPEVTNANTQTAVYGIAEKAAEMILKDW